MSDNIDNSLYAIDYVALCVLYPNTILTIFLFIILAKILHNNSSKVESKLFSCLSLTYGVFSLILIISLTIINSKLVFFDTKHGDQKSKLTYRLGSIPGLFFFGNDAIILLLIILKRMDWLYTIKHKIVMYILPVITTLLFIPCFFQHFDHKFYKLSNMFTGFMFIFLVIFYSIFITIFLLKMNKTMHTYIISQTSNTTNDMNDINANKATINDSVRYCVLIAWIDFSILLIGISAVIAPLTIRDKSHKSSLPYITVALATNIQFMCIFLWFKFNENIYFKFCKIFHQCAKNCCAKITANQYLKQNKTSDQKQIIALIVKPENTTLN